MMMLLLERFDCEDLELAFLSDDSPYQGHRAFTGDEPFRSETSLLEDAVYSSCMYGYAWLIVVYMSDPVPTWGSRRVKLLAGGIILKYDITEDGAWTGQYSRLRYEVVARHIFANVGGTDTTAPFQVITHGGSLHREKPFDLLPTRKTSCSPRPTHSWLGDAVPQMGDCNGKFKRYVSDLKRPSFVPQPLGCFFVLFCHDRHTESWIVGRAEDFSRHRFVLTEFARRPLIRRILVTLGFVYSDQSTQNTTQDSNLLSGHLRNIIACMDSIQNLISAEDIPKNLSTKDSK